MPVQKQWPGLSAPHWDKPECSVSNNRRILGRESSSIPEVCLFRVRFKVQVWVKLRAKCMVKVRFKVTCKVMFWVWVMI